MTHSGYNFFDNNPHLVTNVTNFSMDNAMTNTCTGSSFLRNLVNELFMPANICCVTTYSKDA